MTSLPFDINSPFIQSMLRINPNYLQQIPELPLPVAPTAPVQQGVTEDQVRAIIDERMNAVAPKIQSAVSSLDVIFQRALSSEDFAEFQMYVTNGAPGFSDLFASEKLYPIVQLLWETIKDNPV